MTRRVQVLLPLPLHNAFTYLSPEHMELQEGQYVRVPFGRREYVGVVWGEGDGSVDVSKLKYVKELFPFPAMTDGMLQFIRKVAEYTLSSEGAVLKMTVSVPSVFETVKTQFVYGVSTKIPSGFRLTAARKRVLAYVEEQGRVTLADIMREVSISASVVKGLVQQEALVESKQDVLFHFSHAISEQVEPPCLSSQQQSAADYMVDRIAEKAFSTTLLDGVTGSGKTEVYFAAIEAVLLAGGQVLVLLPEITLTAQLKERFTKRFGFEPAVWHSGVSSAKKRHIWRGTVQGDVKLVLGARSALFLPFCDLRFIIVDEEHEGAYKQEDGVVYHARDMAILRGYLEHFSVMLVSATPSLETVLNVTSGKYGVLRLPSRHGGALLPKIDVIDMRLQEKSSRSWISVPLRQSIQAVLGQGRQVLLFLNRRGYAPLTLCRSCGYRFECSHCSSWLVEHRDRGNHYLQCHLCGYSSSFPSHCLSCGEDSSQFTACGPGVERLADEVRAFFPDVNTAVMTSDTVYSIHKAQKLVSDITEGRVQVVIGTQMIAKGYHFPLLGLVGVIDADLGFGGGDIRAAEKTYQLLHQVAGRAGREGEQGQVMLQSYMPDNAVLMALKKDNRDVFMQQEAEVRKVSGLPPYGRLASVLLSSSNELHLKQFSDYMVSVFPSGENYRVLGPSPAQVYKVGGRFRYKFLVKVQCGFNIQKLLRYWLSRVCVPRNVRLRVDVDPYNFL